MPEPTPDDRAERAFRTAFTRYADGLEPQTLTTPVRRRRGLAVLAAAAAVLAVVGVSATLAGRGPGGPAQPAATTTSTPTTTTTTVAQEDPPVRWVSYRDVEVAVPASWGDEYPRSSSPPCLVDRVAAPSRPYVEKHSRGAGIPTIGCVSATEAPPGFPTYSRDHWVPNLVLADAGGSSSRVPDSSVEDGGWTLTTRTVGDVRLELLTDPATTSLAATITASAREVERDAAGCLTTSPIQSPAFTSPPARDLAADVDTSDGAGVCEYEVGSNRDAPGLIGSRRLSPEEATRVRAAILRGAEGGGPRSAGCGSRESSNFGTAVVLRFGAADADDPLDVHVYYQSCTHRGFDDGTALRALTVEACSPLFGGRVDFYTSSAGAFDLCRADRRSS